MPFTINTEIDLGHFLTFLTILGGVIAWLVSNRKQRSREKDDYARSGALRLLLRLMRDDRNPVASANDLFARFQSPDNKAIRVEYCRKNFLFIDRRQFDGALYRLEDEGKIRFDGADTVLYRQQERITDALDDIQKMQLTQEDHDKILQTLSDGFADPEIRDWDLRDIVRVANRVSPEQVQAFLRQRLDSHEWSDRVKATRLIEVVMDR